MGRHRSGKRPWLAAALALVYPGLGHAYLREWLRGLAWFGLSFATAALALPQSAVPDSGGVTVDSLLAASRALPLEASLALFVLLVLNIVDAYRLARQPTPSADATVNENEDTSDAPVRCPQCGRESDPDFDFCEWCGEPLDANESAPRNAG